MSDIVTGDFNYGSVDEDTAAKLEYFAKRGKALMRKSQIQFIAEFGQVLSEARIAISHHGDGLFIKWATAEFDIGKSTVYNYVNAWDKCLSNGWTNYQHWTQTALYLASADDFPKPAMKKLEKIPATDLVRTSDVKRLIEASKPKPEPAAPTGDSLEFTEDLDADGDPVWLTPVEDDEDDTPEPSKVTPEKPPITQADQAKLNRQLAQSLIDKAVRAVDDLNFVKPDHAKREAAVKLLQGVKLW